MLKKISIGLAIVLVLLVAVVLVAPSFVDWNAYKDRLAAEVERATGRTLTIAGDMNLSVLPTPRLTAERVTLANAPGGQAANMVELEALEIQVALAPLLSGEVQVQSVVLLGPTVYLETLADGSANWNLAPASDERPAGREQAGGAEPAPQDGQVATGSPDGSPSGASGGGSVAVSLDSLSVENGRIVYRDLATGQEILIDALEAQLAADSLQGPFTGEGSAVAAGRRMAFEVRTGRLGEGATPVGLEVTLPEAAESALTFSGTVDAPTMAVEGDLQLRGQDLARLLAEIAPGASVPAPLAKPFSLVTDVSYGAAGTVAGTAGGRLELVGLQMSLGEVSATGDVDLALAPEIDGRVALNVSRLDLDALLAETRGGGGGQSTAPAAGFALPSDMRIGFELVVDALVYNGEVVRQALVNGTLAEGQLQVQQALALLPGGGDVSMSGTLTTPEGQPRFDGQIEAASDNLRGLAEWLNLELPNVPPDRLRRASVSSAVAYLPAQVQFTGIVLEVDSITAQGGVTLALGRAKPAFGAGLTVDRLNLDAYLPGGGGSSGVQLAQTEPGAEPREDPAAGQAPDPAANPLQAFNANLNLRVGTLVYQGQQASDITLQARVQDGVLAVQALEVGDLVGGSASFAGTLEGLPQAPLLRDGSFSLTVPDTTRLARLLNQPAGGPLAELGSLNATGTLSGRPEDFTADVTAQLPEGPISFAGRVQNAAVAPSVENGRLSVDLTDMRRLAQVAGLADSPLARLGAVQLEGQVAGAQDNLTLDLGGTLLGGRMTAAGRVLQAAGALQVEDLRVTANQVQGARLADLIGPQAEALRQLGALDLTTTMNGSPSAELRYDTTLGLLGGQVAAQGTATKLADPDFSFDFATQIAVPQLRQLLTALGADPLVQEGIGLQTSAQISGTPLNVQVAGLNGSLGPATLAGTVAANLTGSRPAVTGNLALGEVPLDRILDDSLGGGGGQSASRWSTEPLALDSLGALDAKLELTAQSISRGAYALQNAALSLDLQNQVLRIAPLTGQVLGGAVRLTATVDARDQRAAGVELDFTGTDLQTEQLVPPGSAAAGRVSGPLTLQLTANTLGVSEAQLVENLAGQGSTQGTLTVTARAEEQAANVLLGILGQQIGELRGITESVNTVFNAFAGAPAQLNGTFDIQEGVVRTQDLSLQGRNAVARATGVAANLPAWTTDLTVDLYRNAEQQSYLTVLLQGGLDDPNVRLSGQALRRQQQQPATEGQPTPDQQTPAPDQAQPQQPQTPEDVLREEGQKLLRGLFNRLQ